MAAKCRHKGQRQESCTWWPFILVTVCIAQEHRVSPLRRFLGEYPLRRFLWALSWQLYTLDAQSLQFTAHYYTTAQESPRHQHDDSRGTCTFVSFVADMHLLPKSAVEVAERVKRPHLMWTWRIVVSTTLTVPWGIPFFMFPLWIHNRQLSGSLCGIMLPKEQGPQVLRTVLPLQSNWYSFGKNKHKKKD